MKEDFLFFDYFVDSRTTKENVQINVIEFKGEIFPDNIPTEVSDFIKKLFSDEYIKLGTERDRGDEGDEYYVNIYDCGDEWEIYYDVPYSQESEHIVLPKSKLDI
jgi:hypothetical protein